MSKCKSIFCFISTVFLMVLLGVHYCIGAEAQTVKIGVYGPMKFFAGIDGRRGAELAAEEINANGGISIKGIGIAQFPLSQQFLSFSKNDRKSFHISNHGYATDFLGKFTQFLGLIIV